MSTCTHDHIDVYFLHDGTPAKFWACSNCMVKFVPITNELRLERDLARALTQFDDALGRLQAAHEEIERLRAAEACAYKLTATLVQLPPAIEKHEREYLARDRVMEAVVKWRMDHDAALAAKETTK